MRLVFLQSKVYWPYTKWFGTAFAGLPAAAELTPVFRAVLAAPDFPAREEALRSAYERIARRHNESGVTEPVDPSVRDYYSRPFKVLFSDRFAETCRATIRDTRLLELPLVGSPDQFADS